MSNDNHMRAGFTGRTALVTGGSSGIGLAITERLVDAGADVIVLARSEGKAAALHGRAGAVSFETCDLSKADQVAAVTRALRDRGKAIDILVNNAGIALGAPNSFWEQKADDIHKIIGVNVDGLVNTTYSALRDLLIPAGRGTILTISSVTGLEVPQKGMGEVIYHATKAFTEGFVNALRNELMGTDIRVLALRPGFVRTNFHFDRTGRDEQGFEDVFQGLEELQPEDVADMAMLMLAQPERISVKALDVVPTAQRSLAQVDRDWNARHPQGQRHRQAAK